MSDASKDKIEELKKLIPEQVEQSKLMFDGHIKKRTIVCNVWLLGKNGARDKLIGSQKRKVGKNDFVVKGKRYWIDYDKLKEGKKYYYYDCDVENAIGSLSFHDVSDKVDTIDGKVRPNQADTMLVDGVVRVLMGKGGIPALYLIVAMLITGVAIAGLMYFLSQYQTLSTQNENLKTSRTALLAENQVLKQQLEANGIPIGAS